jgi:hypothetical protein
MFQFAEEMGKANPELIEGKPTVLTVHHSRNVEEGRIWAEVQARARPDAHI